jgi:hypothetical protein
MCGDQVFFYVCELPRPKKDAIAALKATAGAVSRSYVSIHTRPHPPGDTRRRIEAGGLCLPVNEEVTEKDNDVGASLSNLRNPPEGGGFRPARCFDKQDKNKKKKRVGLWKT